MWIKLSGTWNETEQLDKKIFMERQIENLR